MTKQKKINKIANNIKSYHPKKVILFGSYAWGSPDKNSDFDLFIIKETKKDFLKRSYEVRNCLKIDESFDIIVYTPEEVKERLKINDSFIKKIIDKGKIIYEAV